MTKVKRDYTRTDGTRPPSVTEVIGTHLGWKTQGLIGWAHKLGREGRNLRERDEAAARGSCVHDLVAASISPDHHGDLSEWRTDQIEEARPTADAVVKAVKDKRWTVLDVETPICRERFAGTIDMVVRDADGYLIIVDLKTGRGVYDETVIQLGAYAWLRRMASDGTSPMAVEGAVIHAPSPELVRVLKVGPAALAAGEQAFRLLLDLHEIRHQIKLGGSDV